jgi:hypothetical protein
MNGWSVGSSVDCTQDGDGEDDWKGPIIKMRRSIGHPVLCIMDNTTNNNFLYLH